MLGQFAVLIERVADWVMSPRYRRIRGGALLRHIRLCIVSLANEVDSHTTARGRPASSYAARVFFPSPMDTVVPPGYYNDVHVHDELVF